MAELDPRAVSANDTVLEGGGGRRGLAGFSAWYELFPRSHRRRRGAHGTLADVIDRLDYVARDGLRRPLPAADPPDRRAAPQGSEQQPTDAQPGDAGSPWAIGAAEGGHTAVHPGARARVEDFAELAAQRRDARARGRARHRLPVLARPPLGAASIPSGSGTGPTARSSTPRTRPRNTRTSTRSTSRPRTGGRCGTALLAVVRFWIEQGVTVFPGRQPAHQAVRLLGVADRRSCASDDPDVIFLAEAFTRPKVMERLAKIGFTQSYTYFTWRTAKGELIEYFTELHAAPAARLLPAELLAEHARHPPRAAAARRPAGVRGPARARRDARRATTASTARPSSSVEARGAEARQRGVPRLREVPDPPLGPRRQGLARAADHADSTPSAGRIRRCSTARTCASTPSTTTSLIAYCDARPTGRRHRAGRRQPRSRTTRRSGWVDAAVAALGLPDRAARTRCTTC